MDKTTVPAASRPRTRQRVYKEPPVLEVPDIEADAAERKRVLNVLAQRRYREKKRLSRLKATGPSEAAANNEASNQDATQAKEPEIVSSAPTTDAILIGTSSFATMGLPAAGSSNSLSMLNMSFPGWEPLNDAAFASLMSNDGCLPYDLMATDEGTSKESLLPINFGGVDMGFGPSLTPFTMSSFDNTSVSSSTSGVSFPDSYHLPVHELTLVRALVRISERLGLSKGESWQLDALSPFYTGGGMPSDQLPVTLRPTRSQIMVPHHPVLDFLPWPGVRDRIINILSLPETLRPPNATGPLALVNFFYDVEDTAEGVRIYGEDPYDPKSWEVGQVLFERWWFLFDRDIVETSNRWRRLRGASQLLLKGPNSPSRPAPGTISPS